MRACGHILQVLLNRGVVDGYEALTSGGFSVLEGYGTNTSQPFLADFPSTSLVRHQFVKTNFTNNR